MSENIKLEIEGLSELQMTELRSALAELGNDCIKEKKQPSLEGESHGEPELISAIIQFTPIVLSAVALWLAKQKSKRTESLRYSKTDGKGASEVIEFNRSSYKEGEASASSIETFFKEIFNANS